MQLGHHFFEVDVGQGTPGLQGEQVLLDAAEFFLGEVVDEVEELRVAGVDL